MPLIASLEGRAEGLSSQGLITAANGLAPHHRYFGGSGDHVNTAHLAEIARQTACLLAEGRAVTITKGEMAMRKFVELGVPFSINILSHNGRAAKLEISQNAKICAEMTIEFGQI